MTNARLLARNTALNLFGQIAPLVVAVVAVPTLNRALGSDRFGVLGLVWALIGYFGLFDFGLGRALTQVASESLGLGDSTRLREVSVVSLTAMFLLGCVGAVAVVLLTPWLAYDFLNMEAALRPEAAQSFYLLAITLPFVLCTVGFRGLFEAHQHFGLATALRVPYSLFNFLAPLAVLPFTHSLVPIVATLLVGRLLTFAAHLWFGVRRYPWLRDTSIRNFAVIVPLLRMGGWMTVSSVISPMMVYLDRFVIGALLTMTAVTFYVIPFEAVSKLLFVPAAVLGVFFPAFATSYVQDPQHTAKIFDRAARFMLFTLFPVVLICVAVAREGLLLWVGPDFASRSTVVLQVLAAGVLINSLAQVPAALLQAIGRADLTAKGHMVEFPIYAIMIYEFATRYDLVGVALAWTMRMAIDTAILCWLTRRQFPEAAAAVDRSLIWLGAMLAALAVVRLPESTTARVTAAVVALAAFGVFSWRDLLLPPERARIRTLLGMRAS